MKAKYYVIFIMFFLIGCSTTLSDEQLNSMVPLTEMVSEPEKIIVPVEKVRYVFPDTAMVVEQTFEEQNGATDEELVGASNEENITTVTSALDFRNTIVEYDFEDGEAYTIITSPTAVTDLRLQPGEQITGDAAIGDPSRWQFQVSNSTENGQPVCHLFIRPHSPGLQTSMIVPTNYRTYYFSLRSTENVYMLGVRFRYPLSMTFSGSVATDAYGNDVPHVADSLVNVDQINFRYKIEGKDSLVWKPTAVFSDGIHTYLQMDPRFSNSTGAPALYLLPSKNTSESNLEVINYRVQGNVYIVDFVLEEKQAFMLMAFTNDKKQEKVLITKD